ncbi:MAG: hypothetical protein KJP07_04320 [Desulfatitalea sp.]|nr:hypothetical protein [Desulfatitalea sp.]
MPAPIAAALAETAKRNFTGLGIQLPVDWRDAGPQYNGAFTPPELATTANAPTTLFHECTLNRYHTDAARSIGDAMAKFIDGMSAAVTDAIGKWMRTASVISVTINGPIGTLLPGGVTGPVLKPLILPTAPNQTDMERRYALAVAQAVSDGWSQWQQGLSGVLSYPAFASAPMPAAPPTPNVPAPLMTFGSSGEAALSPLSLKEAMYKALPGGGQHAAELFEAMAGAFYTQFQTFKAATLVTQVMGTGPVSVPPAGPVTGGSVIPTPGNFK